PISVLRAKAPWSAWHDEHPNVLCTTSTLAGLHDEHPTALHRDSCPIGQVRRCPADRSLRAASTPTIATWTFKDWGSLSPAAPRGLASRSCASSSIAARAWHSSRGRLT